MDRWEQIPQEVVLLYKRGEHARKLAMARPTAANYWCPQLDCFSDDDLPPPQQGWLLVKQGSPPVATGNLLASQPAALQTTKHAYSNHSPLALGIASGLIGGGLGYGAGTLLEHLLPQRFVSRGKLRRTLGVAGALPGPLFAAWMASARHRTPLPGPPGMPGPTPSWGEAITSKFAEYVADDDPGDFWDAFNIKLADELDGIPPTGALYLPTIPVDAFNNAVWNDARAGQSAMNNPYGTKSPWGTNEQPLHTPAPLAAATSGLMAGIARQQGASLLSPAQVITALVGAGVGWGTAAVAGKVLGALGGLTPQAQQSLQRTGAWAGLLRTAVAPLFGG